MAGRNNDNPKGLQKMHERDRLLEELGAIHDEWRIEMANKVAFKPETDKPHHPETGLTDYQEHYVDANPTFEQEQVFQDRIKHIMEQLAALGNTPAPDDSDLMSKVSETEEFALAVNGDAVLMLLKTDHEEGVQYYRQGGEWVKINPDDDLPALDEADLLETIGEATELWDMNEGRELSVEIFEPILLDGI
jgi:hypothetical protein